MNNNILFSHKPVMAQEVSLIFKDVIDKALIVDATAGGGGHLELLAKSSLIKKIYAFDRDLRSHDDDAAGGINKKYPDKITLIHKSFSHIKTILSAEGVNSIDGILCDLGVSSNQIDDKTRGFSFFSSAPIDMRMDQSLGITAYEWLAQNSQEEIAQALYLYGGEKKSRSIAQEIKKSWPIENNTAVLAKLILKAMRLKKWYKIHPATRTFQAIRIAVNQEIEELSLLLKDIEDLLAVNGIAVFISFHSLEDRLIKQAFKALVKSGNFMLINKKPLVPKDEEIKDNRRCRSAKLRAIKRIA